MDMNVTNLLISSNSCNILTSLNLNEYKLLKSIEIGRYSFSGYGKFELRNLSKLSTIKIGEIGSESLNFSKCSFVVRGIRVAIDNE